jgi:hypothetical protein
MKDTVLQRRKLEAEQVSEVGQPRAIYAARSHAEAEAKSMLQRESRSLHRDVALVARISYTRLDQGQVMLDGVDD